MSKQDLVEKVSREANLSRAQTKRAVDAFLDSVTEILQNNESLVITGFGTFSVSETKAREGRNPQTGEKITIPAGKKVKFTPGKNLKENIS